MIGVLPAAVITRLIGVWYPYAVITAIELRRKYRKNQLELAQLEAAFQCPAQCFTLAAPASFLFNTLNTISSLMEFDKKSSESRISVGRPSAFRSRSG